jgi:E3 ubiquitin-protein ligase UBR4
LCNECGYCRWSRFDFSFNIKPSLAAERIETEDDKAKAMASIATESEHAYSKYQQLHALKKPLTKVLASIYQHTDVNQDVHSFTSSSKVNKKISLVASIYEKECKTSFESLTKSIQILLETRRELLRYNNERSKEKHVMDPFASDNKCFGCASFFVSKCLSLLETLYQNSELRPTLMSKAKELVTELITNNLHQGNEQLRSDTRRVICFLIKENR